MTEHLSGVCARATGPDDRHHRMRGGAQCHCPCHPGTAEERAAGTEAAIQSFIANLQDLATSSGAHAGHSLKQVGRCVCCSCGDRYQGTLPERSRENAS